MALFHDSAIVGASGQAGGAQYKIERSLRFNSADSAYLNRTPASAGNRKTWTWSGWVKRSAVGSGDQMLFSTGTTGATTSAVIFFRNDAFVFSTLSADILATSALFRDPSAWYHFVVLFDSTQAAASARLRFFVNGSEISQFSIDARLTQISQNTDYGFNLNQVHEIGRFTFDSSRYLNGYLADVHFIDGQALTPTSFGEFDTNNIWQPKAYTGTYGTNGFQLKFADNSNNTATTLGKDTSGNGNNWTPNNLSVTAGAGNDSLVDSPTNYGTDTAAGGEVRGNYCTLNPLAKGSALTLSNGNLDLSDSGSASPVVGSTFAVNSGKWYYEVTLGNQFSYIGLSAPTVLSTSVSFLGAISGQIVFNTGTTSFSWIDGVVYNYSTASSCTTGDVIGVALNFDTGVLTFYKNGVSQGQFGTNVLTGRTLTPAFKSNTSTSASFNFGQRTFAYPLSGFKALCTQNLPTPTITNGATVFDAKLYTGNGSTQTISGLGFSPDFVWLKARNNSFVHGLFDTVRGASRFLVSNSTVAELVNEVDGFLSAFNSDGFTLSAGTNSSNTFNSNAGTQVAWCWDAGSSTVTNTQGSITSQVRANASAGFSIATFTGPTSGTSTVGHGLNIAPGLIITKVRNLTGGGWVVYHSSIGATGSLALNSTAATDTNIGYYNNTAPTSSVFSLGSFYAISPTPYDFLAYCFAPVAGYSSFGSYTGNGSTDGPFVYTGFRPKFVLVKGSSTVSEWWINDSVRSAYNQTANNLVPNSSAAEYTANDFNSIDILSNGFKMRNTNNSSNANGNTYIYAAFAESPFQFSRAR